jgi:hypothetical protein
MLSMNLPRIPPLSAPAPAAPTASDAAPEASDARPHGAAPADPAAPAARANRADATSLPPRASLGAVEGSADGVTLPHVVSRPPDTAALTALISRTIAPSQASQAVDDETVRAMNALVPRSGDVLRARFVSLQRQAMSPAGSSGPWRDPAWWKAGAAINVPRLDALLQAAQQPHASAAAATNALHQVLEHQSHKVALFQVRAPVVATAQRLREASATQSAQRFDGPARSPALGSSAHGCADTSPASVGSPRSCAPQDAIQAITRIVEHVTASAGLHVSHAPWFDALSRVARPKE